MLWPRVELRRSPRVPLGRFVVCLPTGDRIVRGDLSSGGVGFEVPEMVFLGDSIQVSLVLPEIGETASLSAVVCHVSRTGSGGYLVGARFIEVDLLLERPIERYVDELALALAVAKRSAIA